MSIWDRDEGMGSYQSYILTKAKQTADLLLMKSFSFDNLSSIASADWRRTADVSEQDGGCWK